MRDITEKLGITQKTYIYRLIGSPVDYWSLEDALQSLLNRGHTIYSLHSIVMLVKDNIVRYEETKCIGIKDWDNEDWPEMTVS